MQQANDALPIKQIAIIGGGPAGMFMFKQIVNLAPINIHVTVFEASDRLGQGLPYSVAGAAIEHISNVSGNEIPVFPQDLVDWVQSQPTEWLSQFNIEKNAFHEFKVVPRLLFGKYLSDQFDVLCKQADANGVGYTIELNCSIEDVKVVANGNQLLKASGARNFEADIVIMCTGHHWPRQYEGTVPGYYDSPYPPTKLAQQFNHPIAITGGSLTAVDAVRTLARQHGRFEGNGADTVYVSNSNAPDFKIMLHAIHGLLPAARFHLTDSHLNNDSLLTKEELDCHMQDNGGFLSLDFIFENDFKRPIQEKDPVFFNAIKEMDMETFVGHIMRYREGQDPFDLLREEYREAAQSIKQHKSVYWKEMLGVLSFAMNYPAKHFSAEDMLRLRTTLMPLISIVIAYLPQSSCEELLALHTAGVLEMKAVEASSKAQPQENGGVLYETVFYKTYINCIGQPHLSFDQFPFKSLLSSGILSPATIQFRDPNVGATHAREESKDIISGNDAYYLKVPGVAINDCFQPLNKEGIAADDFFIMAVPYISGFNPDYSGLDFCEEASGIIAKRIFDNG